MTDLLSRQSPFEPTFSKGVPAWLSTFLGNVICVTTLSVVIPGIARRFG